MYDVECNYLHTKIERPVAGILFTVYTVAKHAIKPAAVYQRNKYRFLYSSLAVRVCAACPLLTARIKTVFARTSDFRSSPRNFENRLLRCDMENHVYFVCTFSSYLLNVRIISDFLAGDHAANYLRITGARQNVFTTIDLFFVCTVRAFMTNYLSRRRTTRGFRGESVLIPRGAQFEIRTFTPGV